MTEPLRLLQFSDTHLMSDPAGELKGVRSLESLQFVLQYARGHHWNADALLVTGDLVHDDPGAYAHVNAVFGALGKPVHCLPGNHDDVAAMHAALAGSASIHARGLVDFDHWRVVLLDSVVAGQAHGLLSSQELVRFEQALTGAGARHVLVCLHHHPVQMASRWLDTVKLQNSAAFFAIADRFPNVRAVSWGHVHQQFDVRRKGVRLLAVPSTCAQFAPYSESFAVDAQARPGYRRFVLHADGNLETEVVRVDLRAAALQAAG